MENISLNCIHCNQSLEAPAELLGQVVDCPACQGRILIESRTRKQIPTTIQSVQKPPPAPPPFNRQAPPHQNKSAEKIPLIMILAAVALCALIWGRNYISVQQPVAKAIQADSRNSGVSLTARYQHYFDSSVLILDLTDVTSAAPSDLFRVLFQSADALNDAGRRFDKVILARSGTPVFQMQGDDYATIGREFGGGQNPIFLVRTLPEKLYKPSGISAFGSWEGGWIGVLKNQMEDANMAATQWAKGY